MTTTDTKLQNAYKAAEEKRRKAAILRDRATIPMDFDAKSRVESRASSAGESDPLWKRVWRTEGIRYLGREGNGVIDAMERFEHAFMLGYRHGVGDMLGEAQWLIKANDEGCRNGCEATAGPAMMNDEINPTADTPRTDAAAGHAMGIINEGVLFCSRQLERELDESKADLMRTQIEMQLEIDRAEAEVERLGGLLYETRSLLTEFFDCVDIGGLHDGDCNISTEDPEKWDLGCN